MKKIKFWLLITLGMMLLFGCSMKSGIVDPLKEVTLSLQSVPVTEAVNVTIIDYQTQQMIGMDVAAGVVDSGYNLEVKIIGDTSQVTRDGADIPSGWFTIERGAFTLEVTSFSGTDPIELTLAIRDPQGSYIETGKVVRIEKERFRSETIVMTTVQDVVSIPGVSLSEADLPIDSSGQLSAQVIVNTATGHRISLPAGIQILSQGVPITGTAQIRVIGFQADTDAEAVFPGGFDLTHYVNEDGSVNNEGGIFITGGFIMVNILANGTVLSDITLEGGEAELSTDIPTAVLSGMPLEDQGRIAVWSFKDGSWVKEGVAEIEGATHTATLAVSHFSCWNFDWFYSERYRPRLVINNLEDVLERSPYIKLTTRINGRAYHKRRTITSTRDAEIQLYNVPATLPVEIIAEAADSTQIGTTGEQTGVSPLTLDLAYSGGSQYIEVEFNVSLSDTSLVESLALWGFLWETNSYTWKWINLTVPGSTTERLFPGNYWLWMPAIDIDMGQFDDEGLEYKNYGRGLFHFHLSSQDITTGNKTINITL